jgi:hypothetical protein
MVPSQASNRVTGTPRASKHVVRTAQEVFPGERDCAVDTRCVRTSWVRECENRIMSKVTS